MTILEKLGFKTLYIFVHLAEKLDNSKGFFYFIYGISAIFISMILLMIMLALTINLLVGELCKK
jgi:hypothetical protein